MSTGNLRHLDRLLDPRSVAVIGGKAAEQAIRQSDRLEFRGEVWPVHPGRRQMNGRPVYSSLDDLPGVPDAAFVAVNRLLTLEVVHRLAAKGCGGAVLYASGFAESGPEGVELQKQLTSGHDMPLVGPNCYGTINAVSGAVLWPDIQGCSRVDSGPALVSQSGSIALNLTMNQRGVDFSHVISLGNQTSVTAEECLMYLAGRSEVTAVGLYLESIIDPIAFGRAALACQETRTPVVVLKTGRTDSSGRITASHTAALRSPSEAYDALFERYGIIVADSLAGLVTILGFLHTVGPLSGNRLVSLSCSGGEAALVADQAVRHPVVFEPFAPDHSARVQASLKLNAYSTITNPLDYHTFIWGDRTALERCFIEVLSGPFDAALLIIDWPADGNDDTDWWPTLEAFASAVVAAGTPGLVVANLPENLPDRIRRYAARHDIAVAYSTDEALAAAGAGAAAGSWFQRRPPSLHFPAPPIDPREDLTTINEPSVKALLRDAGIAVPDGVVFNNPPEGTRFTLPDQLRYPVVAKMVGPAHKSISNGVITGIRTDGELFEAVGRLGGTGWPVLVERQITDVVSEMLVSVRQEYPIGQVLTVGAGGVRVELLADTVTLLLPTSPVTLAGKTGTLRIGRHQAGKDGQPGVDPESLAEVVNLLATFLADHPDMVEVEINPLILTSDKAWAVDAMATVRSGCSL